MMGSSGLDGSGGSDVFVVVEEWWLGLRPGLDIASNEFGDRRLMSKISTLPPV